MSISGSRLRVVSMLIALLVVGLGLLIADSGPNHQVRTQLFGSSGGNINDASKAFCCSGTLGSLVKDSSNAQYILSNNHVLARADQAVSGEDISQPGLIDNNCRPGTIVGDFTVAPQLGSNVDAALAALRSGTMDSTGNILDVGVPHSTPVAASVNATVAKSGRTTGLTCGSVQSTNTSVKVQYQRGCNSGKKFTVAYTNQVVVGGSFSAGGDSGSLIVTQSAAHPTALLFAGSSSTTIGNPIGQVLSQVSSSLGKTVGFVGNASRTTNVTCPAGAAAQAQARPSQSGLDRAAAAHQAHVERLMADPAILAVGVGASTKNPNQAVINIYVQTGRAHGAIPAELDGVRTQIIRTDLIRAYGWNEQNVAAGQSCSANKQQH